MTAASPLSPLRVATLLRATLRDLLRRPGALLALAAAAVLTMIVPRLARRALDDGAALGVELVLSTTWLYATTFAGLAAARAAAMDAPLGLTVELLATPLRRGEFVVARAFGIAAAALAHASAILMIGFLALALSDAAPALDSGLGLAILGGALQIILATAVSMALGATLGAQLGTIAVIAFLLLARLVIPGLTESGASWTWLLPDLARLDFSRTAAFGRDVGAPASLAASAAATVQSAALLLLTRAALGSGRSYGSARAG